MAPGKKAGESGHREANAERLQEPETSDKDELLRLGRIFQDYLAAVREIEQTFLDSRRSVIEVRAAAAEMQKALDIAVGQAGGCAFGPRPLPLRHIFAGLADVERGLYSKVLSPAQHQFGEQYDTHHRRMIIGYALAVLDVVVESGGKSSSEVKRQIVDALNRAGFRVPITQKRSTGTKTSGEVTAATLEQWRKRARSGKGHYAETYQQARKNLDNLLKSIDVVRQPHEVDVLIEDFEKLVEAYGIED